MADTVGAPALRRLKRELDAIRRSSSPQVTVQPSLNSMLEWHFAVHNLPPETPYSAGCYHGKILFPTEYPHAPPSLILLTPSGRFETNKRLCLSMTDFHPESWNPAWSVETILVGFVSYFVSDKERGYGTVVESTERRQLLAASSWRHNAGNAEFRELFPQFMQEAPDAREGGTEVPESVSERSPEGTGGTAEGSPEAFGSPEASLEEPMECWICRDTTSEPLIQPCACRGSMSGVHASCVESWIQHHRRNAVNAELPRCSVCHRNYEGFEQRPGLREFAGHLTCNFTHFLLREIVLIALLLAFQLAFDDNVALWLRIVLVTVFGLAVVHKATVLTVSLPLARAPPARCTFFFVEDRFSLTMHIAEAFAGFTILAFWCGLSPRERVAYFAPCALAMAVPLMKMCVKNASWDCLKRGLLTAVFLLLSPVLLLGVFVKYLIQQPRRVLHPLDAGWQIAVSLATVPLCLLCKSNASVVLIWGCHSVLLLAAVLELFCVKRLRWVEGVRWWFALQLSALSWYTANVLCFFEEGFGKPDTNTVVFATSAIWLALTSLLVFRINWQLCVRYYRRWQNRHGRFTLQADGMEVADPAVPLQTDLA